MTGRQVGRKIANHCQSTTRQTSEGFGKKVNIIAGILSVSQSVQRISINRIQIIDNSQNKNILDELACNILIVTKQFQDILVLHKAYINIIKFITVMVFLFPSINGNTGSRFSRRIKYRIITLY